MRVIVVNDHIQADGGADVVALASARALAAAGVDVSLLVGAHEVPAGAALPGVDVVCTGQPDLQSNPDRLSAALQGLWSARAARATRELLARCDPAHTVVHLHSWTKSLSSSVVRATLHAGFPLVLTLHDYFSACPNGAFFDFQRGVVCHRQPMSLDCIRTHCDSRNYAYKLYRVARQSVQSRGGKLPGGIGDFIVVSRFSERLLRPFLPATARVHYVRNPIEVPRSDAADVAANRSFVMAARMLLPKGQQIFLEACERADLAAVCIGGGPQLASLRERFKQARFTGQLPREQVFREMRAARAFVMPALWYETQGIVVDEAASMGVPAVVAAGCAASESIVHEQTGLRVASGDVADLAQALKRLWHEPALAARLGGNAHAAFWRSPPTLQQHAADLLAVYGRMLEARSADRMHGGRR